MNLINKLKTISGSNGNGKNNAMSLFGIGRKSEKTSFNPFVQTSTNPVPIQSPQPQASSALETVSFPQQTTTLDNILENHDAQIKLGLAHDKALDLLTRSVDSLALKLEDVRADRLPSVVAAASKVVESIRKERNESAKNGRDREVHYHFYTPSQRRVEDYEVIDIASSPA